LLSTYRARALAYLHVTMPDGEILHGEYQVTDNAAVGVAVGPRGPSTAYVAGSGRPVVVSATGDRGTIINCQGSIDIGGRGSAICETNRGGRYRVMI
jgi:hypothetical protein